MELSFKCINAPMHRTHFLEHVYDLHHVPLEPNESYNKMFEKLKTSVANNPEKLDAADRWVAFNKVDQEHEVFDTPITTSTGMYAIFDFIPTK